MDLAGHLQILETSGLESSHPKGRSCSKVKRISTHKFAALLIVGDVIVLTLAGIAPALLYEQIQAAALRV